MKYSTIVLGAALCAPTLALAQDISGAITNGFGRHSISGIDQEITTNTLDGRVSLAFENGMTLGVEGGYTNLAKATRTGGSPRPSSALTSATRCRTAYPSASMSRN